MPKSLWPDTIRLAKEKVAPVSILKKQASFLGQQTQNLVIAEVESRPSSRSDSIDHIFYLVAPALGNYRFELFRVSGSVVNLYPIKITSGTAEINNKTVTSENKLLRALENIFSHPKTIKIIESMLAQSM